MKDIERALNVEPPPLLHCHPLKPLYEACKLLIRTHARRLPLLDRDQQTGDEVLLSVLTQYRVLKFIAINVRVCLAAWMRLAGSAEREADRTALPFTHGYSSAVRCLICTFPCGSSPSGPTCKPPPSIRTIRSIPS